MYITLWTNSFFECVRTCTCTCTYTHMLACKCTHTHTHTHAHVIIMDIQNTQCILLEYMVSLLLCTFPSLSHTASLLPVIDGLNSTTLTSVRSQSRALIRCFKESRAPTCCSTERNHYSDHWKVCEYHRTCVYTSNDIEKLLCNTLCSCIT